HVPWIHNVRNMDLVAAIDDAVVLRLLRLFNEPAGQAYLTEQGVDPDIVGKLHHFGISSIANIMGAIKLARYYEYNERDTVFTVATDSLVMYESRLAEAREAEGEYTETDAAVDFEGRLLGVGTDNMLELSYNDKKRMHNLKYFTWVEQQGKDVDELDAQWYDDDYWTRQFALAEEWDRQITAFNERTGVLKKYLS
ncbi:MAG: pyridoxal-5-phosphate-dependent protein subunit beta, partial [Candidatus Marinimicrobia bacterium]|nr:pyridoxal-5-phosphate-dependent protein subunit beta [Candidatus Neomarinimicrobiota bacterium]